jgi:DNA polymerase-3 subunit beta
MNIIVNQKNLSQALRAVEKIVSKNITLPILNSILFRTDNGRLRLSATNLEMGINYWVNAKINQEGEFAVPARIFSDFVANVFDEKLSISSAKNVVLINSEGYKSQILGIDSKDFPIIPKSQDLVKIVANGAAIRNALLSVIESASLSESRPEISGILVNISSEKIEFAATDSFRLAEKRVNQKNEFVKKMILPRMSALEIIRLAEYSEQDLEISLSDNQVFVKGDDFEFISRLIDGHYPEYKKIIPEKHIALVRVDRDMLERNVRMASVFSSAIADIKLIVGNDLISILAKNSDRGEVVAKVVCKNDNQPFEIALNYNYLLDGLKSISSERVNIFYTGEGSPLVLKGEEDNDLTYVIMPLRN